MCVGARPPFDHPHVFLDMGDDHEIICPYCSTLFGMRGSGHGRFPASRMRAEGQGSLTSAPASRTIVIAGAGIGGLTAAIALAEQRFHVIVLEKAPQLDEAGAGIQLSPNASGILIRLGLEKHLIERVVTPGRHQHRRRRAAAGRSCAFRSAPRRRSVTARPTGSCTAPICRPPCWQRAREHPDIDLRLGAPFEDVAVHAKGVTVVSRNALERETGRRSRSSARTASGRTCATSISTACRRSSPATSPGAAPSTRGSCRASSAKTASRYGSARRASGRLSGARRRAHQRRRDRRRPMEPAGLERSRRCQARSRPHSTPPLVHVRAHDHRCRRQLAEMGAVHGRGVPLGEGPVALLGDAAHAMLPFAAQGAAMAIEDAAVLADCLSRQPANATEAFRQYAAQRQARVAQVSADLAVRRDLSPARPRALARNLTMKAPRRAAAAVAARLAVRLAAAGVRRSIDARSCCGRRRAPCPATGGQTTDHPPGVRYRSGFAPTPSSPDFSFACAGDVVRPIGDLRHDRSCLPRSRPWPSALAVPRSAGRSSCARPPSCLQSYIANARRIGEEGRFVDRACSRSRPASRRHRRQPREQKARWFRNLPDILNCYTSPVDRM